MSRALTPLHSYMPLFLDLPKPPAYLLPKSSLLDTTATTATPPARRAPHPFKKSNLNAMSTHDQMESALNTSSGASADTVADDWEAPYDDRFMQAPVHDTRNDALVAQLTALISDAHIARASTSHPSPHSDRRPSYGDSRKQPSGPRQASEPTMDRACYAFFVDGTCPRENECRYSHDSKIINEARLACMSRWKAGTSTVLSNLSVLDNTFPLDTGSGPAYSQDERNGVYEYVEETVAAAQAARLP